ncbi:Flotillin-like [Forsythia ovata]|uniref:Flotillin-like n=1 Tax=Forsythia ovata TaxID=205694 RepID=A0ABD1WG04_9LAMI
MNAFTQTEKLKAEFLSKASVEYETKVQEANWDLYKKQNTAEAYLYQKEREAEAQKVAADATFYRRQQIVDGEFGGMFQEMAEINGEAVRGLSKIAFGQTEVARQLMALEVKIMPWKRYQEFTECCHHYSRL